MGPRWRRGYGALSCDHLEHLSDGGVAAMAAAGTVAVLLPGAFYFLRETRLPPITMLRAAGVPMAVASDHNPGSSPALSLLLMLHMACTLFRLTPEEALRGVTMHAARALGLAESHGSLAGRQAGRLRGVGSRTPQRAGLLVRPQPVPARGARWSRTLMAAGEVFTLHRGTQPLLVSVPHAGTVLPEDQRRRYVPTRAAPSKTPTGTWTRCTISCARSALRSSCRATAAT